MLLLQGDLSETKQLSISLRFKDIKIKRLEKNLGGFEKSNFVKKIIFFKRYLYLLEMMYPFN